MKSPCAMCEYRTIEKKLPLFRLMYAEAKRRDMSVSDLIIDVFERLIEYGERL